MKKISRRNFIKAVSAISAASVLAACGGSSSTSTATSTAAASTAAAGGDASTKTFTKMKIGVAVNAVDETFMAAKEALEGYVGETLNVEFMFSEAISDVGALISFVENAYASACDAVYSNVTNGIDQAAAKCDELGMYFVGISSGDAEQNRSLPHYVSVAGASAEGYGQSYAAALNAVVGDGEEHSILILSGAACYGATSFIEATAGSLRALESVYGLTYTKDIDELTVSDVQTDCENDKGIKITIFPGMSDMATNVSPLLQSGVYDVLVGTTNIYDSLSVAVNEVEVALNKDIKFISRCVFSDAVKNAFNSQDSQGSPVLDAIVLNGTYEFIAPVLILRNAFDGYVDNMRNNGECSRVPGMAPLVVTSPEEYNVLSADNMPYCYTTAEDLLALTGPDVTYADIDAYGASLTAENIIEKFA